MFKTPQTNSYVIAQCPNPKCQKPILAGHDSPWCFSCGEYFPENFVAQIPLLQKKKVAAEASENVHGVSTETALVSFDVKSILKNHKALGIVIGIIGVAMIVISPSLFWQNSYASFDWRNPGIRTETIDLRGITLFSGVALLIVGGIIYAIALSQSTSAQPTTSPTPSTQPVATQFVSPKSVELGNTPDEVQLVMGKPDKIINLGARVIHVYNDMKIIYVDGKVSDVQLS